MKPEGRVRVNAIDWISLALVVVGALNWGLIGVGYFIDANWNLVDMLLGSVPLVENLVYVLVGLAALYEIYFGWQLYTARHERPQSERPT